MKLQYLAILTVLLASWMQNIAAQTFNFRVENVVCSGSFNSGYDGKNWELIFQISNEGTQAIWLAENLSFGDAEGKHILAFGLQTSALQNLHADSKEYLQLLEPGESRKILAIGIPFHKDFELYFDFLESDKLEKKWRKSCNCESKVRCEFSTDQYLEFATRKHLHSDEILSE